MEGCEARVTRKQVKEHLHYDCEMYMVDCAICEVTYPTLHSDHNCQDIIRQKLLAERAKVAELNKAIKI